MTRPPPAARASRVLGVAVAALLGCSSVNPGDCYDCGECGLVGGPNQGDSIGSYRVGAAADGTPTVQLTRYVDGACAGDGGSQHCVRRDTSGVRVDAKAANTELDTSGVTLVDSGYEFTASGDRVLLQWVSEGLELTFLEPGSPSMTVVCTLGQPNGIVCAAP